MNTGIDGLSEIMSGMNVQALGSRWAPPSCQHIAQKMVHSSLAAPFPRPGHLLVRSQESKVAWLGARGRYSSRRRARAGIVVVCELPLPLVCAFVH